MSRLFEGYEEGLPFGPAAGAISGLSEEEIRSKIIDVLRSPAEATTWGSITWNRSEGNAGIVYYHNSITGQTVNSIGLANIGHARAVGLQKEMQQHATELNKPLIPSFSPGRGEDPLEVLPAMAYGFAEAGVKIMEVNYSCPNKFIEGSQLEPVLSHDLDTVREVDSKILEAIGRDIMLIRKFAPLVGEKRIYIPGTIEFFRELGGKAAANFFNTIGGQRILTERGDPALNIGENHENLGGLSGPALVKVGRDGIHDFRPHLSKEVGLISCLGVEDGVEVYHRVQKLGADFTQGVTVLWENEKRGLSFGQTITKIAEEYHVAAEAAAA